MRDISKRIKNIEKRLNLNEQPIVITIVKFGGQLPPDRTEGNVTYHFVMFDRKASISYCPALRAFFSQKLLPGRLSFLTGSLRLVLYWH